MIPPLWMTGVVVYLLGVVLAAGPKSRLVNWAGTLVSMTGVGMTVYALYLAELL